MPVCCEGFFRNHLQGPLIFAYCHPAPCCPLLFVLLWVWAFKYEIFCLFWAGSGVLKLFVRSPGFWIQAWNMGYGKEEKKKKTPEWRKRTVGLWHPISSAKEMLQHTLVIHSLSRKPPPCSIWTAEVVSHKVKYQKELPNVNPKTYIGKQTFLGGEQDPAGSNSGVHRRVSLYRDTTTASHWCRWTVEPSLCHSTSSCTEIVRSDV